MKRRPTNHVGTMLSLACLALMWSVACVHGGGRSP